MLDIAIPHSRSTTDSRAGSPLTLHVFDLIAESDYPRLLRLGRDEILRSRNSYNQTSLIVVCGSHLPDTEALRIFKLVAPVFERFDHYDSRGLTALHWVCCSGQALILREMIQKYSEILDVTAKTHSGGDTALHLACRYGHVNCVRELVAYESTRRPSVRVTSPRSSKATGGLWDCPNFDGDLPIDVLCSLQRPSVRGSGRTEILDLYRKQYRASHSCCVYFDSSTLSFHESRTDGSQGSCPWEAPERVAAIADALRSDHDSQLLQVDDSQETSGTSDDLLLAHSERYINALMSLESVLKHDGDKESILPLTPRLQHAFSRDIQARPKSDGSPRNALGMKSDDDSDTSFSMTTMPLVMKSVGLAKRAVERALLSNIKRSFCVIRPPGHHAGINGPITSPNGCTSCGFCVVNNVAIAAKYATEVLGVRRVAILDLDAHHGNGTEEIVLKWNEPEKYLFASLHIVHESGEFYPGSGTLSKPEKNVYNFPIDGRWPLDSTKGIPRTRSDRRRQEGDGARDSHLMNESPRSLDESSPASAVSSSVYSSTTASASMSSSPTGSPRRNLKRTREGTLVSLDGESPSSRDSPSASSMRSDFSLAALYRRQSAEAQAIQPNRNEILATVQDRIVPLITAFRPELLLVSIGFDGEEHDVGNVKSGFHGCSLKSSDYYTISRMLCRGCNLIGGCPLVAILEGGYGKYVSSCSRKKHGSAQGGVSMAGSGGEIDRRSLASSALHFTKGLLGPPLHR